MAVGADAKALEVIELLITTNLTQKEIAERVGFSAGTVANINCCRGYTHLHNYETNIRAEAAPTSGRLHCDGGSSKKNYIGKRFNRLLVLEKVPVAERPSQTHGNYWKCLCDCGTIVKVPTSYLSIGSNVQYLSCGCMRQINHFLKTNKLNLSFSDIEMYTYDFERYASLHRLFVKNRSIEGISKEYYLTAIDYFWHNSQFNAVYDFWETYSKRNDFQTYYDWAKPSLDHIIPSSRGGSDHYTNLQVLTVFENLAKRDMTQEEWSNFKQNTGTTSSFFIDEIFRQKEGRIA